MVDDRFVEYFKRWKGKGYSDDQIKRYLISAGHDIKTVDDAMAESNIVSASTISQSISSIVSSPRKKLLPIFIIMIVVCTVLSIAYFVVEDKLIFFGSKDISNSDNKIFSNDSSSLARNLTLDSSLLPKYNYSSNNSNITNQSNIIRLGFGGSGGSGSGGSGGSSSSGSGSSPAPTCIDGSMNQGETGIDCGGPCTACPSIETCFDDILNQDETGFDCGGVCSSCFSGITYYVSNSLGNDSWSGLASSWNGTDGPWKTLTKVNSATLSPGDAILFKRNDTWVVTSYGYNEGTGLDIDTYSGTRGNPITYGAYGNSNDSKPIITGRQSILGWNYSSNWTQNGNIWSMTLDIGYNWAWSQNNRGRIWLNGVEVQKANSSTVPTVSFPWTHNGNILYIYATSNPASYYSNIEWTGSRGSAILAMTADYIMIQNLDIRGNTNLFQITGSDKILVENCDIGIDGILSGLVIDSSNNMIIKNNVFDTNDHFNDTFSFNNAEDGLIVNDGSSNFDIYNNTFIDWGHTSFNIQVNTPGNAITNITFHHNLLTAPDIDYGRGFTYNVNTDVGLCTGNELYNNLFYNHPTQIQIAGDGLKFYNNIIDTVTGTVYRVGEYTANGLTLGAYGSYANNHAINNEFYNNVIMNARDFGLLMSYTGKNTQNNTFRNNIFYNNGIYQIWNTNSPGVINNIFENNLLYEEGEPDVVYYEFHLPSNHLKTIAEFNAVNGDHGNVVVDNIGGNPLFVDDNNSDFSLRDYHLQAGSPAIHAGINVGLMTDYDGVSYNSSTPSIGPYEYVEALSTCNDSIKNGNETGIDCGGAQCEACSTFTRTFYVSNSGSDSNTGTSRRSPWKTIANINNHTFEPGDGILFKRGDTWRETLTIPSSGNSTQYITFGSYSTGNKPRILGSNVSTGWTSYDTNVWISDTNFTNPYNTTEPYGGGSNYWSEIFFVESDTDVNWGTHKNNTGNLTAEYDWTWNVNHVYIYSPIDPDSRYNAVEVPQRARTIFVDDYEYIIVDGFQLQFASARTIQTEYPQQNTSGLIIKNCNISYVGSRALELGYHLALFRSNMLIQNNDIHDGGRRDTSFHLMGTTGLYFANITIENNTLHNGYHSSGVGVMSNEQNSTIENIIVRNNLIWDPPTRNISGDGFGTNEMCSIKDESTGFNSTVRNIQIYNNIFMYVDQTGIWLDGVDNASVYHNTFYDFNPSLFESNTYQAVHIEVSNNCTNISIKNNIFYGSGNRSINGGLNNIYIAYSQNASNVDVDYNLFYQRDDMMIIVQNGAASYRTTTWANIKTDLGWQTHEPGIVDPLFVDAENNDFRLQSNSPAKWTGINISAITNDYSGMLYHNPPSIGAFEYTGPMTCNDTIMNGNETGIDCGGSCEACSNFTRTFYVSSSSGNDSNNGTTRASPWKTITKVNSVTLQPGDGILFKRGDTWREQLIPSSGSSAGYITYGAYDSGAKPLFLGSVQANSGWSEVSTNIWQNSNAAFTIDVGNLIFNNEESVGVKIMSASPTLDAQGEFWYDFVNDRIRMYSVGNPASVYTNIECALRRNIIQATSKNYNIFENLDLRYGASHGYGSGGVDHVIIRDCDISFIGGGDQTGVYTVRYGNAIEFWADSHDIVVERCKIDNIYDAGITPQGDSGGTGTYQVYNLYFRNNTISNCEYSYELFWHDANASSHDIYFENNTCVNAGGGWGHNQRPDGAMGAHVRIGSVLSISSNISIQNNIFYEATERTIYFHNIIQLNKFKLDYNNYSQSENKSLAYNTDLNINYYTLADWQAASSQEVHAIDSSPSTPYFEFIWFSDLHVGDPAWTAGELDAFVSGMNGKVNSNIKFAVASGDEIYTTGLQSEVDTYNTAMTGLNTTLYSLRGNHDGDKFTQHFVVDEGNIRLIAFYASYVGLPNQGDPYNNTGNVSAAELAWIETQLQTANGKKCILVAHYPLSSNFWGYIRPGYGQEEIINLSNEYGVKLYLNGHQHDGNQIGIVGNNITDINSYAAVGPGKFMIVKIYTDRVIVTPYNGVAPFVNSTPVVTVIL